MEDDDSEDWFSWIFWIVIGGVIIYFLFFRDSNKAPDYSSIEPRSTASEEQYIDLQNRLDDQESKTEDLQNKLDDQQQTIDEQNQKQDNYNNCVKRWSNLDDYIKPADEAFCRRLSGIDF